MFDTEVDRRDAVKLAVSLATIAGVGTFTARAAQAKTRYTPLAQLDAYDPKQRILRNMNTSRARVASRGVVTDVAYALTGQKHQYLRDTGHAIIVKMTLVDGDVFGEHDTFDEVYDTDPDRLGRSIITQWDTTVPVFDPGAGDYWVAMPATWCADSAFTVTEHVFTKFNLNGEVVDDCIFDADTGIAYIPKHLYFNDEGIEIGYALQFQAVIRVSADEIPVCSCAVTVESAMADVDIAQQHLCVSTSALDPELHIPLVKSHDAARISRDDVQVWLHGYDDPIALSDANAAYDSTTGELTLALSAFSSDKIAVFIKDAAPAGSVRKAPRVQPANNLAMWPWGKLTAFDPSAVHEGQLITYQGYCRYASDIGTGGHPLKQLVDAHHATVPYCYAWLNNAQGATGPGTTIGLKDAVLNGATWDSLGGVDMANMAGAQYMANAPHIFEGPNAANMGAMWAGLSDATGNTLPRTEFEMDSKTGPNLVGYCAHTSHSISGNAGWNYNTVYMRILKIDQTNQFVVCGFVTPCTHTQTGVCVVKFPFISKGKLKTDKNAMHPEFAL